jgi:hypothetical protein
VGLHLVTVTVMVTFEVRVVVALVSSCAKATEAAAATKAKTRAKCILDVLFCDRESDGLSVFFEFRFSNLRFGANDDV